MIGQNFFGKNEIKLDDNMQAMLRKVPANSLLIIDLDKTVICSDVFEGSETWYYALVDVCVRRLGEKQGLHRANAIYNQVQQGRTSALSADKEISWKDELAKLRARGVKIIGMTARQGDIAEATIKQVSSVGFSADTELLKRGVAKIDGEKIAVVPGYIFSGNCSKGPALDKVKSLFCTKALNDYPHVSFFDDRRDNCLSVNAMLERKNIPHTVTMYTKVDEQQLFPGESLETYLSNYYLLPEVKSAEEPRIPLSSL